jgi:hypothetical protein
LLAQRKSNQKKEHPHACPSGSLRCSDKLAGCELATLKQAHPETPANPALLSKPERDFKIKIKNMIGSKIVGLNSFGQDLCE